MTRRVLAVQSRPRRAIGLRYGLISFAVALATAAVALATASIGLSAPAARAHGSRLQISAIVGTDPGDRSTPSGFWPSDHAGLFAELAQVRPSPTRPLT